MFGTSPSDSGEFNILHYWRILRKRQLIVVVFATILVVTTAIGTALSTPYYAAKATIEISPDQPSVLDVEQVTDIVAYQGGSERRAYYTTQYRIIQSRTVIGEVVRRLREEHAVTDFDELEDPIAFYKRHLQVQPEMDTRLVHLVVEYPDADKAALFANVLAQTYMDANLERTRKTTMDALAWLSEQQEVYRQRRLSSSETLKSYEYTSVLAAHKAKLKSQEQLELSWSETRARRVELEATYLRLEQQIKQGAWLALASHLSAESSVLTGLLENYQDQQQERTRLAARYKDGHPEMQRIDKQIEGLVAQIRRQNEEILSGRKSRLDTVMAGEEALAQELEQVTAEVQQYEAKLIEYDLVKGEAEKNADLFRSLDQRLSEVDLSKLLTPNNIWFVDQAEPVHQKVRPNLTTNLPIALMIGLLGGVGLAFFVEFLDSTIKSRDDIEGLVGVSFLGAIPMLDPAELAQLSEVDRNLYVNARPRSTVAEALRSVRTNILFRLPDRAVRRLLITSAAPREGKSFVSSNLATIVAMTGSRVLLIDADLRRPSQHKLFQTDNDYGLSNVLCGEAPLSEVVRRTHVPGLDLLTSGPRPPNPAELLGSEAMTRMLDTIKAYDFVLIDSPPVGAVADPLILSRCTHGVLMVVESNKTDRDQVMQSRSRLAEMNANILGAIVNKLDIRKSGYGYYYYYDYNSVYYDTEVDRPDPERHAG